MASRYEEEKNGKNIIMKFTPRKTPTRTTPNRVTQKTSQDVNQSVRNRVMAKAPQFDLSNAPTSRPTANNYTRAGHVEWALAKVREAQNKRYEADRNRQMRNMFIADQNNQTAMNINNARMQNNISVQKLQNQGYMDRAQQRDMTEKEVANMQIGANISSNMMNNEAAATIARQKEIADLSKTTEGIKSIIARVYSMGDIDEMTTQQQYRAYSEIMQSYVRNGTYPKPSMQFETGFWNDKWVDNQPPQQQTKTTDQNATTKTLEEEYNRFYK